MNWLKDFNRIYDVVYCNDPAEIEFINETSEGKRPIKLFMKPKKSEGSINSLNMQADAQQRKIVSAAVRRVLVRK